MSEKNKKHVPVVWQDLSAEQTDVRIDELRQELLKIRLNSRFTHNPSFSSDQQALKKEIARGLTHKRTLTGPLTTSGKTVVEQPELK